MEQTKEFMLVFRYTPNKNYQPTAAELTEIQQQWGTFIGNIALQEKLVSTHQLGYQGKRIATDKSVTEGIHIADKQTLGGNMIVKTTTIDEAVQIGKDCPILLMGGSVEVRDILPM